MSVLKRFVEMELGETKAESLRLAKSAAAGSSARLRMTMQGKAIIPEIENPQGEQWIRSNKR